MSPLNVAHCQECDLLVGGNSLQWALDHLRETGHAVSSWGPL